jgi:hypothetical protein
MDGTYLRKQQQYSVTVDLVASIPFLSGFPFSNKEHRQSEDCRNVLLCIRDDLLWLARLE